MNTREIWKRFDIPLFAVVLLLSVFGVALISSAIAGNPTLEEHPRRQVVFLIIGLAVLFLCASLITTFGKHSVNLSMCWQPCCLLMVFILVERDLAQPGGWTGL